MGGLLTVVLMPGRPLVLVVDDLRSFPPLEARSDVRYARTSAEGVSLLARFHAEGVLLDELWLDHDLGEVDGSEDDVRPVLDWLLERFVWDDPPRVGRVVVHTSNPVGAQVLVSALSSRLPVRRVDAASEGATVADPAAPQVLPGPRAGCSSRP